MKLIKRPTTKHHAFFHGIVFLIFLLSVSTSSIAYQPPVKEVRGEPVLESDILLLPPVCKLILVDKPGAHFGAGDGPLRQDAHLFERPVYAMAKNNPHLHHYCWALILKAHYFRSTNTSKKKYLYQQILGDIDYVLRKTDQKWPYFHVLLVEQGQMMRMERDYIGSLSKADQALKYNPEYDQAYSLKADVYAATGDKNKAIEVIHEGLKKAPKSKLLKRKLERLDAQASR